MYCQSIAKKIYKTSFDKINIYVLYLNSNQSYMSIFKTNSESGVYLGQDRPPENEQNICELDKLQFAICDRVKRLLFELKRVFG
jgi:hypothetical protein